MAGGNYSRLLKAIEERFAGRIERLPVEGSAGSDLWAGAPSAGIQSPLAIVRPAQASEVELLAQMCARRSIPRVAEGAGTAVGTDAPSGRPVVVWSDDMRRCCPPGGPDNRVTVELGISWFEFQVSRHIQTTLALSRVCKIGTVEKQTHERSEHGG